MEKQKKKNSCFHAYGQVSQKYKKFISYFHIKKLKKECISMHFEL